MSNVQQQEEKATAASYIINFFTDSEQLRHTLSQYINVITELKATYKDFDKLDEQHKHILKESNQFFRYYANMVYVQYKSIIMAIPKLKEEKQEKRIDELYKNIRDNFIIKIEDAEEYTQHINMILIKNIMRDLLESSTEIINNLTQDLNIQK